jgi:phosphoribosylamine--glycine ligase
MNNLGYPFKGILYAGLMFTKKGIYLIEYNVRLGDPECQSIFSRLKSDFLNIALMTEKNKLDKVKIKLDKKKSLCIVMASKGYPEKYKTGFRIQGLNNIKDSSVNIYHAGTAENNKKEVITNGGRVLNVVIKEKTLESAISKGYNLIKKIKCPNIFFRKDIGS